MQKATKVDCGIFAQAAKEAQEARRAPVRALMDELGGGYTLIPEEFSKFIRVPKRGVSAPYKGGSKTAGLLRDGLHKNAEFADKVLTEKDLLG